MTKAAIIGVGTACPANEMSQTDALSMFQDIVCENDRQRRLGKVLFRKSGVRRRRLVVPHTAAYSWCKPEVSAVAANKRNGLNHELLVAPESLPEIVAGESSGPTTGERMQIYRKFASGLALQSAEASLADANQDPSEITHLITVTCTGFDSPGVDIELINRLGLPPTTQRINVGFMGCHAAINGLRAAMAIVQSDPGSKVLVTAVELCSLHYRFQWDMEGVIGNALFADGSASAIVASTNQQPSSWKLTGSGSVLIPDSSETMSWTVGDHGFEMLLTNEIGDCIENNLKNWLVQWLDRFGLTLDDIDDWGVHPGGPRILSAVQTSLSLTDDDLATSRSVLQQHGNMSSATVLFILKQFIEAREFSESSDAGSNCLLLAFGPGLVAEVALLQRSNRSA